MTNGTLSAVDLYAFYMYMYMDIKLYYTKTPKTESIYKHFDSLKMIGI